MKNTLFTNYYSEEREKATREFLLDSRGDDNPNWETIDDIPDGEVFDEMNFNEQYEFKDILSNLNRFFDGKTLIVTGSIGTWRGTFDGGKVMTIDKIYDCWKDCDYIEIYDDNGHLYIRCTHHDGTNHFEVKILTEKGITYHENWNYNWNDKRSEKEVYNKIMESSCYSHIPHFAKKVYGIKTR